MKRARVIRPRSKKHYVNNKTLYEEMVKYRELYIEAKSTNGTLPKIPKYVGECLMMICQKLSTKPNFMNYSYRDSKVRASFSRARKTSATLRSASSTTV